MKPNNIRSIDFWLGQPICFLLSLLSSPFPKQPAKPKKIIFLKFIEQGATVLAYSALKQAVTLVGKENVYFCVFLPNRPILDILGIIPEKNIISIRDKSFFIFLKDMLAALLKIRKEKIDTAIDMEFFSRASAIFSFLSGAKTRVGLHRFTSELPYRGNLMTHRIQYNPYLHISHFYRLLVDAALENPAEVPMMKIPKSSFSPELPVFSPDSKEKERIIQLLQKSFPAFSSFSGNNSPKSGYLIILNPNASDLLPLRKWDKENFIALGKKLLNENPATHVVISGAPSEEKEAENICRQIDSVRAVSFAGKTSLRELLTLYTFSDMLVTNDSGPGHFSSLTPIRTIILFGPETPRLFGPLSPRAHVIWKELPCSPCVNVFNHRFSPCNNNVCMKSVTVEEVHAAVKKCLAG